MARIASAPDTGTLDSGETVPLPPDRVEPAAPRSLGSRGAGQPWIPRLIALLALLVAAVAVVVAVVSVQSPSPSLSEAGATGVMNQLDTANHRLSDQLTALKVGASPRSAQDSNRAAYALAKHLEATVPDGGDTGAAVHDALRAEVAYTDAVGSTIYNPRSALRSRIVPLAAKLRTALIAANGDPARVAGAEQLVAAATARAGG